MTATSALAVAGILTWIGYEVLLRRRTDSAASSWRGDAGDRGSTRLLIGGYVVSAVVVDVFTWLSIGMAPIAARWAGIALIVCGLALRAWGMSVLGRYYTRTLRTVADQRVVQEGPYRAIRHPGYCGSLLVWIGYALGLGSLPATLIVAVVMVVAYGYRIAAEERLLIGVFGDQYVDYRRHTARLIPSVY